MRVFCFLVGWFFLHRSLLNAFLCVFFGGFFTYELVKCVVFLLLFLEELAKCVFWVCFLHRSLLSAFFWVVFFFYIGAC